MHRRPLSQVKPISLTLLSNKKTHSYKLEIHVTNCRGLFYVNLCIVHTFHGSNFAETVERG